MTRNPKIMDRLLKAVELSALSSRTRLVQLQSLAKQIESDIEACKDASAKPYMAEPALAASLGKRIRRLNAQLTGVQSQIAAVTERVRRDEGRKDKVGEWLEEGLLFLEESELQDITEECVASQIHASPRA